MNPFLDRPFENSILSGDLTVLGGSYIPDTLPHREEQIQKLVYLLESIMRNINPSNLLIYGRTGSGKTSTVAHVTSLLSEALPGKISVKIINCQVYDSIYSIIVTLVNSLSTDEGQNIPLSGWTLDRIYTELIRRMEDRKIYLLIVLDEIDKLVQKNGSDPIYVLLKLADDLKRKNSSLIGITNYIGFVESLDARVQSRLSQETIMFPPYNAVELRDIIKYRVNGVVKNDAIEDSAISLCAAIAAQEHGDARKALDLMRMSIEIAIREGMEKITEREVARGKDMLEINVLRETIKGLPVHSKFVLLSSVLSQEISRRPSFTGEVYDNYCAICGELGYSPLTSRRVGDILSDLDDSGLIVTKIANLGRRGRTRYVEVGEKHEEMKKYILEEDQFSGFHGHKVGRQTKFDADWPDKDRKGPGADDMSSATMDPESIG